MYPIKIEFNYSVGVAIYTCYSFSFHTGRCSHSNNIFFIVSVVHFLILLTGWICVMTSLKILILCRNIEISLMENLGEVFKLRWCILLFKWFGCFLWQITLWSYLEAIERYESLISMWRRSSWTRFHLIVSLFVCVCVCLLCASIPRLTSVALSLHYFDQMKNRK